MLDNINNPQDLKKCSLDELTVLAEEIRDFLITTISKTGGHLASNLGAIELTIALHYVFDAPDDSIIWDVSHQSYVHKILTGRREKISTIRKKGGISGFANIKESRYDTFGAGHSSTSISAALGVALANKINDNSNQTIAVIGDGALTGGMAFEAINNMRELNANVIIIVNDNKMSIDKNVGGLSKHLTKLTSGKIYSKMKNTSMKILDKTPKIKKFAQKSEEHFKGMFLPTGFFESLGIEYFGPINGHDIRDLIHILSNLKNKTNPRVLHIVTKKGNGHKDAENNPYKFHGITPKQQKQNSYSDVFGTWLVNNADNKKLVAITPAMGGGSGMTEFSKLYPKKFFDTGIAEQHTITFAAALAVKGFKPIVAIYSTFLQRGYDQFIHDAALQNLNVVFAIDRAGIVGGDGATHNGCFDLSFLLPIPHIVIAAPSNGNDLYKLLNTAIFSNKLFCIRYPKGNTALKVSDKLLTIGKAEVIRNGDKIAILSFGNLLDEAIIAAEKINATLINMLFIKPIDKKLVLTIAKNHKYIITIEENVIIGGAGEHVLALVNNYKIQVAIKIMGIPDKFIGHGNIKDLYNELNLNANGIIAAYKELIDEKDL